MESVSGCGLALYTGLRRHNYPRGNVGEQANTATENNAGNDRKANQRDVDVEVRRKSRANARDLPVFA
jgi:hypothetical protein